MAEQERGRQVRLALVYQRLRSTQDLYTILFSRTLDLVKVGQRQVGSLRMLGDHHYLPPQDPLERRTSVAIEAL